MANEIITTLHPDHDPNTNLYPNIKKENIPNQSVDYTKIENGTLGFVTPEMFGAIGDGVIDDTLAIQNALSYCGNNNKYLLLMSRYLVSDTIYIEFSGMKIEGSSSDCGFIQNDETKDILCYKRTYLHEFRGEILKNITLTYTTYGDVDTCGIRFTQEGTTYDRYGTHNSIFENIVMNKCYYGIYADINEPLWCDKFINIMILSCQYQAIYMMDGFNNNVEILVKDTSSSSITRTRCMEIGCGGTFNLDIEDWDGLLVHADRSFSPIFIPKIHLERCTITTNYGAFLSFGNTPIYIDEVLIYNCTISSTNYGNLINYYGNGTDGSSILSVRCAMAYNNTITNKFSVIATQGTNANIIELLAYNNGFDYGYYPYGSFKTNCWIKNIPLE